MAESGGWIELGLRKVRFESQHRQDRSKGCDKEKGSTATQHKLGGLCVEVSEVHRHSIIYRLDLSTLGRAENNIGLSDRSLAERGSVPSAL